MNWLDLIIGVLALIGLIKGLFDGIIKQILSMISLVLAILFAGRLAKPLRDFLIEKDFISALIPPYIINSICYIFAFVAIIIVFNWIAKILEKVIKITPVFLFNNLLGGLLGASVMLIIMSLIFNVLKSFDPNSYLIKEQIKKESSFYNGVEKIIPTVSPFIRDYFDPEKLKGKIPVTIPIPNKSTELEEVEV